MKLDRSEIAARLRQMADDGLPRPLQRQTLEGRLLSQMTCRTTSYHDAELDSYLRATRPDWFSKPRHAALDNKRLLIEYARAGRSRSDLSTRETNALNHYICDASGSLDLDFRARIMAMRPDWFRKSRVEQTKLDLIAAANEGRPRSEVKLKLQRFTQPARPLFDAELRKQLQELRPEWFEDQGAQVRRDVIEYARAGNPRPNNSAATRRIYIGFRLYGRKASPKFNQEFHDTLQELRPDWFEGQTRRRVVDPTPS